MAVPVIIDDIAVQIPEAAEEISLWQYLVYVKHGQAVSPMMFAEAFYLGSKPIDPKTYYIAEAFLSDVLAEAHRGVLANNMKAPNYLGVEIDDIGKLSLAQYKDLEILAREYNAKRQEDEHLATQEYLPYIVAIYLQPIVFKQPYDNEQAHELAPHLLRLSAIDMFRMANFFLLKLVELKSGTKADLQSRQLKPKKWMQAMASFKKRLGLRSLSTRLQAEVLKQKITS
jgi:hypothetical protein